METVPRLITRIFKSGRDNRRRESDTGNVRTQPRVADPKDVGRGL